MTSLKLKQLVSAYESEPGGRETVEALAKEFELDVDVVTALLQSQSAVYRLRQDELKEHGSDVTVNPLNETPAMEIPGATLALIQQAMITTALSSEDERLRFRAQCRVMDEGKGRLDKKLVATTNITVFNNHFAAIKKERELRKAREQKVVEVAPATNLIPA